jgi:uncharacterized phiE125 gp8 family phage protein
VLTTDEAKAHLRVDTSSDDTLINSLVEAATRQIERDTGQSLITQTWALSLHTFPDADYIQLPKGPVQSVTSIKTYGDDNSESTFSSDYYYVDTNSDEAVLTEGYSWETDLRGRNAVLVTYVTGYGDASSDVPEDLITAVKLLVGHWYENREAVNIGNISTNLPLAYNKIVSTYHEARL